MQQSDAVWLIAPETADALYQLSCLAEEHDCLLIGCTPQAVKLTSSKSATIEQLVKYHVPCVPVISDINLPTENKNGWVIKPDGGAGGEGCFFFNEPGALKKHIDHLDHEKIIVQEYIPGIPASISMLCHKGRTSLLACNEQLFEFNNGKGQLNGIVINGLQQYAESFAGIAGLVGSAIEGLEGYVGIDLVISDNGPQVLEVNPRLTTAYTGLSQSLGLNPAAMVLETLQTGRFPDLHRVNYLPVTIRF